MLPSRILGFLRATLLLCSVSSLAWALVGGVDGKEMDDEPDVPDLWPSVTGDRRKVTWAHAVNNRSALKEALDGDVMMLEADVSLNDAGEPIMAHPPANQSDLSLREFLAGVFAVFPRVKKGIKLDFKSIEAFDASVPQLQERHLPFPVWLNADIVDGPGGTATPVNSTRFLGQCTEHFPTRTLSVGWTTGPGSDTAYTDEHIEAMDRTLTQVRLAPFQPMTFPVRAGPASRSHDKLNALLDRWPNATFTIWGANDDQVDVSSLVKMATLAGFDRVYVDLPTPIPGLTPPDGGDEDGNAGNDGATTHGPLPPTLTAGAAALAAAAAAAVLRL